MNFNLSLREKNVLALIAQGHTDKEIAELFDLSVRTIHSHIRSIFDKMNAKSRAHAVSIYYQSHPNWKAGRRLK
mgnify:CR=1 FL=1